MDRPKESYVRECELLRIKDGDTFLVWVDQGWTQGFRESIRLVGVDTPEERGAERIAGEWVTKQILDHIGEEKHVTIHSEVFKEDTFSRTLAQVWVSDIHVNQWLLENKYGWPTDDKGKLIVPRNIDLLTGIPFEIRTRVKELQV